MVVTPAHLLVAGLIAVTLACAILYKGVVVQSPWLSLMHCTFAFVLFGGGGMALALVVIWRIISR